MLKSRKVAPSDPDAEKPADTTNYGAAANGTPAATRSPTLTAEDAPTCASAAFAIILATIGGGGRWQWRLFFITSFCGSFTSLHNIGAVFLAAEPDHWCAVPGLPFNDSRQHMNGSIPTEIGQDGKERFSRCLYYDRDYPALLAGGAPLPPAPANTSTLPCPGYHYDTTMYTSTVVSEFDLVCSNRWMMTSVQSTYMLGFMVGALVLSELADKYGRRTLLLASTVGFIVTAVATFFSVNYLMFITLRFLIAAFGSGIFLSNFVILMEGVGIHYRTLFGVLYHGFFSLGICNLAALGYLFRDWRTLQLWCSVPSAVMLLYYFILPESPRWLLTVGREEEAIKILRDIAETNKTEFLSNEKLETCVKQFRKEKSNEVKKTPAETFLEFFQNVQILVATPNMRRRCLIMFFAWFTVSMVYYGLAFNGNNLKFPIYLMIFISGVVEIASIPVNIWILNKCGRRLSLVLLLVVCGVACLAINFVPRDLFWWNLFFASVGRFLIASCFSVVFIYSSELVPTNVRNIAMGASSMCARIGSFLAPYIVDQLGVVHYAIPSSVFGAFSLAAGLSALLLPETGRSHLPEGVAEIEALPR